MFSGGFDSTLVAYKALTESGTPVLLHHINIIDINGRWIPERIACNRLTRTLAEITRPFSYTESTIDFSSMLMVGSDEDLVLMTAARLTLDLEECYKNVIILEGTNKTDLENGPMGKRFEKRGTMEDFFLRCSWMCKTPQIQFPIINLSKKEVLIELPEVLMPDCFYCRAPNAAMGFCNCGKCVTCKQIEEIKNADY